jgi:hypothetical protein
VVEDAVERFLSSEPPRTAVTAEWLAGRLCLPLAACSRALERLTRRGTLRRLPGDPACRYQLAPPRLGHPAPWPRPTLALLAAACVAAALARAVG